MHAIFFLILFIVSVLYPLEFQVKGSACKIWGFHWQKWNLIFIIMLHWCIVTRENCFVFIHLDKTFVCTEGVGPLPCHVSTSVLKGRGVYTLRHRWILQTGPLSAEIWELLEIIKWNIRLTTLSIGHTSVWQERGKIFMTYFFRKKNIF